MWYGSNLAPIGRFASTDLSTTARSARRPALTDDVFATFTNVSSENAIAWVQLSATVGLLAVTGWYAATTRRMANDSARAAEAAERSAVAALEAATVAKSKIQPEFTASRIALAPNDPDDEYSSAIKIDSSGDAVVVSEVWIRRAFRKSRENEPFSDDVLENVLLEPAVDDSRLPQRLHQGEHLILTHPALQESQDPYVRFILDVHYAFSEEGHASARRQVRIDPLQFF